MKVELRAWDLLRREVGKWDGDDPEAYVAEVRDHEKASEERVGYVVGRVGVK